MSSALSTFYHPLCTHHNHRTMRQARSRHSVRSLTVMSSRKQKSPEEGEGVIQRTVTRMISDAEKIGKNLKPDKKGDVKDLMLMSLSFAVYVYISQLMVRAYFAWTHASLPNPSCSVTLEDPAGKGNQPLPYSDDFTTPLDLFICIYLVARKSSSFTVTAVKETVE